MLEQSQQQSEELAAQEEEMRQNLEELMATQEESGRKQSEMDNLWNAMNVNNIVVLYNLQEEVEEVNNRFTEIFGLSKDRVTGSKYSTFGMDHWKDTAEYNRFWEDLRSGISKKKTITIKTDKGEITLAQTFTPILDSEGSPSKILQIGIVV